MDVRGKIITVPTAVHFHAQKPKKNSPKKPNIVILLFLCIIDFMYKVSTDEATEGVAKDEVCSTPPLEITNVCTKTTKTLNSSLHNSKINAQNPFTKKKP